MDTLKQFHPLSWQGVSCRAEFIAHIPYYTKFILDIRVFSWFTLRDLTAVECIAASTSIGVPPWFVMFGPSDSESSSNQTKRLRQLSRSQPLQASSVLPLHVRPSIQLADKTDPPVLCALSE